MLRATVCALSLLWSTAGLTATPRVYALIVAENRGPDETLAPLRYADDDGVRYYELFSAYADEAELLSVLDADTQRQNRGVAEHAAVPTRDNLLHSFERMNASMRADMNAGLTPIFYLVYTGHGGVGPNNEGFVTLHDGKLTRTEMYDSIVAKSAAAYNHLIIDACDSYFFVNARGGSDWVSDRKGAPQLAAVEAYVSDHSLERYPNTGVLLSTSRASESHEWSRYGAGVFSHEVRSGLVGTADVNSDGRIAYSEIAAYVAAANLEIDDPKARLEIYARPPAMHRGQPLFDLRQLRAAAFLQLDRGDSGHLEIEDDRGVRYADFNKAPEHSVAIGLLPQHGYYVRRGGDEVFVPKKTGTGAIISLTGRAWQPRSMSARDATSDAFSEHLYAVPYGPSFYRGYVATSGDEPVSVGAGGDAFPAVAAEPLPAAPAAGGASQLVLLEPATSTLKPWAIGAAVVSAASAAGAIVAFSMRSTTVIDAEAVAPNNNGNGNNNGNTGNRTATAADAVVRGSLLPTYILAGTAVATGITSFVLFLLDDGPSATTTPSVTVPSVTVAPLLGGGGLAVGTFAF